MLRTLEREPERRYQQASQLKTEIQTIEHAPAAPASRTPATPSDAENPLDVLKIPATGLLVAGIIDCVGLLLALVVLASQNVSSGEAFLIVGLQLAGPFVVVGTVATLLLGAKLFAIPGLEGEAERAEATDLVAAFDENDGISSRSFFWFSTWALLAFIAVIATTSVLPVVSSLGMGYVALSFALIMLLRYKSTVDRFYQAVDWDLLGFFCALFVVVYVMEHAQVLTMLGAGVKQLISLGDTAGTASLLVSAAAISSVTDNIPLAAMLANILKAEAASGSGLIQSEHWWAVIFGANLGGNLTPIGSASTLVAVTVMHKHGVPMSFAGFVKKALPYALLHLLAAVVYVLLLVPLLA